MKRKKTRLDYKWVILTICFLMELLSLGFCSSNAGLYTKAVTEALEIKRSLFSLSLSFRYAVQVIAALYFGNIVGKFGVKKMTVFGIAALTASVLVRAFATEVWHLFIGSGLWGLGIVFAGSTMAGTIVRRWFRQDVGRYTGMVMSANGIGGALAAQIITPIINNGEVFGYRKAYLLSAALAFGVGLLVLFLLRENPADGPAVPTVPGKKQPKGTLWAGIAYSAVRRKPYFYVVAAMIFLTGISLQSIGTISVVYMSDVGFSAGFIAAVATVSSLCLTCTKILVGRTYDKKGLRFTLLMCQIATVAAFMLKALYTNSVFGMVIAMTATVLTTVAAPMETVMIPLLTNDLFGSASYNKVLGVFMAMNSLGLCLGSPLADLYYDVFGTYKPCFWFFAAVMAVVMAGYQFVLTAAKKDKAAVLAQVQEEEICQGS